MTSNACCTTTTLASLPAERVKPQPRWVDAVYGKKEGVKEEWYAGWMAEVSDEEVKQLLSGLNTVLLVRMA